MANGFGEGSIGDIFPDLGVGTITPDDNPEDTIIFTEGAVPGGIRGFRMFRPGDRVRYDLHPRRVAGKRFAHQIMRIGGPA